MSKETFGVLIGLTVVVLVIVFVSHSMRLRVLNLIDRRYQVEIRNDKGDVITNLNVTVSPR